MTATAAEPRTAPPSGVAAAARPGRLGTIIFRAAVAVLLALAAAIAAAQASGVRWFVVESPSMGRAAPVGTLVVDAPVRVEALRVGDVITYRPPPTPQRLFTHRVIAVGSGAVHTRGDVNGAPDPWVLHVRDVVGRAALLVPGAGWLLKALPLVGGGSVLVFLVTALLRSPTQRAEMRLFGTSVLVAAAGIWLHPFTGVEVITTDARDGRVAVDLVSTALLPIRVAAAHGGAIHLESGQTGGLTLPISANGHYALQTALDLGPTQWLLLMALCLAPMLIVLVVGLPADDRVELP